VVEVPNDQVADLLRRSQFAFEATIVDVKRSTVDDVDVDDHTVVARVDRVLNAPAALAHSEGREVTVQLLTGSTVPAADERLTLFTTALAFGSGIALAEVGRADVESVGAVVMAAGAPAVLPGARPGRPHPVLAAAEVVADERLQEHAREADAIIVGRVVHLEQAGQARFSEHEPDWWRATIAVDHVEKGDVGSSVTVLFPNSSDVHWARVPKVRAGEHGLWLLHASEGREAELAPFTLLDGDDAHPADQLERLRGGAR